MSVSTRDTEDWSFKAFGNKEGLPTVPASDGSELVGTAPLSLLAVSSDARYMACASASEEGRLVCGETAKLLESLRSKSAEIDASYRYVARAGVLQVAFLANCEQLAVACADHKIELYSVPELELQDSLQTSAPVTSLQSYRAKQGFVYSTEDGCIYEVANGVDKKLAAQHSAFTISSETDQVVTADLITLPEGHSSVRWIGEFKPQSLAVVVADPEDDEEHLLYVQDEAKNWLLVEDACPAFGDKDRPFAWFEFYIQSFPASSEFTVLAACSRSPDLMLVSQTERMVVSDDSDKLPFTTEDEDVVPMGAALVVGNTGSVSSPLKGVDSAENLPVLLVLTQEGRLLAWHLASRSAMSAQTTAKPSSALDAPNLSFSAERPSISDEEVEEISHDDAQSSSTASLAEARSEDTEESKPKNASSVKEEAEPQPEFEAEPESKGDPDKKAKADSGATAFGSGLFSSKWAQGSSWADKGSAPAISSNAFSSPFKVSQPSEQSSKQASEQPKAGETPEPVNASSSSSSSSQSLSSSGFAFQKSGFDPSSNPFAKFQAGSSTKPAFAQPDPAANKKEAPKSIFAPRNDDTPALTETASSESKGFEPASKQELKQEPEQGSEEESEGESEEELISEDEDAKTDRTQTDRTEPDDEHSDEQTQPEESEASQAESEVEDDTEARLQAEAEAAAKAEAEQKAREEAKEAEQKAEAEAKARQEADAKKKAEDAERKEKEEAEAKRKAQVEAKLSSTTWMDTVRQQFMSLKTVLDEETLQALSDFDTIYGQTNFMWQALDHNLRVLEEDPSYREGSDSSASFSVVAAEKLVEESKSLHGEAKKAVAGANSLLDDTQQLITAQGELENETHVLRTELEVLDKDDDAQAYYLRPLPAKSAILKRNLQSKYATLQKQLGEVKQKLLFAMLEQRQDVDFGRLAIAVDTIDSRLTFLSKRVGRLSLDPRHDSHMPPLHELSLQSPPRTASNYRSELNAKRTREAYLAQQERRLHREQVQATEDLLSSWQTRDPESVTTFVDF